MEIQDRLQLSNWLRGRATLAEVEGAAIHGLAGNVRFTESARRAYILLWSWTAIRFSGTAGIAQDKYYARRGMAALQRRIARANALAQKLST